MLPISSLLLLITSCLAQNPIVTTHLGKIQGLFRTTVSGRQILAFDGVPYAQQPIRFEEAKPVESWDDIKKAQKLHQCVQFSEEIVGDEDCLYLNVYSPNTSQSLPVMVHIHGGGFMMGNNHEYVNPDYILDHDIVLVSLNYRLGIFGFLSTEDEVLPGNLGLKDQSLALKWVKENIASFGGNPDLVTITGISAGGASVQLHYFSKLSKNLFQRGLSRSGCALNPWVFPGEAKEKAKRLGGLLGCPQNSSSDLVNCLKTKNSSEIMSHLGKFYEYKVLPTSAFGPVIEKGPGAFITKHPYLLLKEKKVQNLPWMASFVEHDGKELLTELQLDVQKIDSIWETLAPFYLHYNYTLPKNLWTSTAEKIRTFYAGENQKFADNVTTLIQLSTDRMITNALSKALSLQASATNSPVYLYQLRYTGTEKTIEHYEDNQYFYLDKEYQTDTKMADFMVKLLVSFVRTGTPEVGISWKTVKPDEINCLNIAGYQNEDISVETIRNLGNGEFWDTLGLEENKNFKKQ